MACRFACVFLLLLAGPAAFGQTKTEEGANPPRNRRGEPELGHVLPAKSLLGLEVRTEDGKRAGQVADVALDLDAGYVAAVMVSTNGGDSSAGAMIAVPWPLIVPGQREEPIRLKLSQAAWEGAPRLKAGQSLQEATRVWLATVYQHYELEPYWDQRQQASTWGKASDYGKLFDPNNMVTVQGRITDVSYLPPLPGMALGTQLTITTERGVVKAQLGPLAHLSQQNISFAKGAPVKVRGSEIKLAGHPVIMATVVETGEQQLKLREPDGTVHWQEWTDQDARYAPASLKQLVDTPIRNNRDEDLGKIADFAIATEKGVLAYVAMTCTCFDDAADKLYPVPLSAFVVQPKSQAWLLELPLEVLENTKPFPARQWPEKIDRGWVEYVHVRYGRSPFGGVRTQPHAEPQKK